MYKELGDSGGKKLACQKKGNVFFGTTFNMHLLWLVCVCVGVGAVDVAGDGDGSSGSSILVLVNFPCLSVILLSWQHLRNKAAWARAYNWGQQEGKNILYNFFFGAPFPFPSHAPVPPAACPLLL